MSNFPNFQATFTSNTCAFTSSVGPLRAPYMKRVRGIPLGDLLVLVVLDITTIISPAFMPKEHPRVSVSSGEA